MKLLIAFACLAVAAAAPQGEAEVRILKQDFDQNEQGSYQYSYELDNGVAAEESGEVSPGSEPETGSIDVQGSFQFVADDGNTYSVSYQANEAGFQPSGDHLPVAPAQIPEYAQLREQYPELFWAEQ